MKETKTAGKMLRKITNEELYNLPTTWENSTVDTFLYYENVIAAFEVDPASYNKVKKAGLLCQSYRNRYYVATDSLNI